MSAEKTSDCVPRFTSVAQRTGSCPGEPQHLGRRVGIRSLEDHFQRSVYSSKTGVSSATFRASGSAAASSREATDRRIVDRKLWPGWAPPHLAEHDSRDGPLWKLGSAVNPTDAGGSWKILSIVSLSSSSATGLRRRGCRLSSEGSTSAP